MLFRSWGGLGAFSGVLYDTHSNQVVFHESHDEAGNAPGAARTIRVAVNGAPLFGATRTAAEARSRLCFGLSLLSAGTPMFFMGEEIGAQRQYNKSGNYQASFSEYLKSALALYVTREPNLERDCTACLPAFVLTELRQQVFGK